MFANVLRWFRTAVHQKAAHTPVERWIMLDVETTGLNPRSDQLLAIAAVALRLTPDKGRLEIVIGDCFDITLRQDQPSEKENILIHHIGVQAQFSGQAPAHALEQFRVWVGHSPLLAFHASFDQVVLEQAFKRAQLATLDNAWLDIEPIARVVGRLPTARALDDWLKHFGIECMVRHQAVSDAFATAELLCRLWPAICKEANTWPELQRLARNAAWISC